MADPLPTIDPGGGDCPSAELQTAEQPTAVPPVPSWLAPRRRWYQFSLRALLGLFVLAGVGLTVWRLVMEPYWSYRAERSAMALVEKRAPRQNGPGKKAASGG